MEFRAVRQAAARRQHFRNLNIFRRQVDTGHAAAELCHQAPRRTAGAATDIDNLRPGLRRRQCRLFPGSRQTTGMELVDRRQLFPVERFNVDPFFRQGVEYLFAQVLAAVMSGDRIDVGHSSPSDRARSRSSERKIFPLIVLGNTSSKDIARGYM